MPAAFRVDPIEYLTGDAAAIAAACLAEYYTCFTGRWFHALTAGTSLGCFEAADVVAVEMLSVTVPPNFAVWLLSDQGQNATQLLLGEITSAPIDAAPASEFGRSGPAWTLLRLLESSAAQWPASSRANGVGPTIAGKLLAAKRPALIPIYDPVVAAALAPLPTGSGSRCTPPSRILVSPGRPPMSSGLPASPTPSPRSESWTSSSGCATTASRSHRRGSGAPPPSGRRLPDARVDHLAALSVPGSGRAERARPLPLHVRGTHGRHPSRCPVTIPRDCSTPEGAVPASGDACSARLRSGPPSPGGVAAFPDL
jgi:hypothetical protein